MDFDMKQPLEVILGHSFCNQSQANKVRCHNVARARRLQREDWNRRGSETVIGPHGSAQTTNDNGDRMKMMCSSNDLYVGNTLFKHKKIHKMTWISPDGNTQNNTDYVCISRH